MLHLLWDTAPSPQRLPYISINRKFEPLWLGLPVWEDSSLFFWLFFWLFGFFGFSFFFFGFFIFGFLDFIFILLTRAMACGRHCKPCGWIARFQDFWQMFGIEIPKTPGYKGCISPWNILGSSSWLWLGMCETSLSFSSLRGVKCYFIETYVQ